MLQSPRPEVLTLRRRRRPVRFRSLSDGRRTDGHHVPGTQRRVAAVVSAGHKGSLEPFVKVVEDIRNRTNGVIGDVPSASSGAAARATRVLAA